MKVSVIIPAHNEENYLPQCLQSLQEQDYKGEWEIIVVDNASTDATAQIARDFGARVVPCPKKGVVYARQAGVEASQGDIIVQTDADAILPPSWISQVVQRLAKKPQAVAVAGEVLYLKPPLWVCLVSIVWRLVKKLSYWLLGRPATILASNLAFRREAFNRAGGYNLGLPAIGDEQDWLVRLSKIGKILYDSKLTVSVSSRRFRGRLLQYVFVDFLYYSVGGNLVYSLAGKPMATNRSDIRWEIEASIRWQPRWLFVVLLPIALAMVALFAYGYFSPASQVFGKVYSRDPTPEKTGLLEGESRKFIALTFDDGPNEPYTTQVLDILKRYNVKATFFVLGKNVEYYPDVARRIVDEGHILGNHSYDHKVTTALLEWQSQLDSAQKAISQTTGVKPRLFRPPFGQKTPWELDNIHERGFVTIGWSISAKDPHAPSSDTIAQRIIGKARPGGIILLHDGNETKHGWKRSRTVEALPYIVEHLQAQGYTFVTVPQLLGIPDYFE